MENLHQLRGAIRALRLYLKKFAPFPPSPSPSVKAGNRPEHMKTHTIEWKHLDWNGAHLNR